MHNLANRRTPNSLPQPRLGTEATIQTAGTGRTPHQLPAPRISLIDVNRSSEPFEVRSAGFEYEDSFELHRHHFSKRRSAGSTRKFWRRNASRGCLLPSGRSREPKYTVI